MNIEGRLKMEFERYFQVWDKLTREKQEEISGAAFARNVKKEQGFMEEARIAPDLF